MCKKTTLAIVLLACLTFSACGGKPTPDVRAIETQTAAKIFATQTAVIPTQTQTPQATVTPKPTATREPTPPPEPTLTPEPTATLRPSATPTPEAAIPPRGTYKHGYEIVEKFDRFEGVTVVQLNPRPSEYQRGPGSLRALYFYWGTTPAKPPTVSFSLVSTSGDWRYLKCYSLSLLLDSLISMHPITKHEGDVGRGYVIEFVNSRFPINEFLQIVNAKKVEGKLCNTEFLLSSEQLEALRDLASRMQP